MLDKPNVKDLDRLCIVAEPDQIPLTAAHRRLAAHRADPTKVILWEQIKAEALARMSK
jgi:hypothetical protein